MVKVTTARLKVKSWSDHDFTHLHPITNVPTKYQLPTPYGLQDIACTRFFKLKVIDLTKYQLLMLYSF